MSGDRGLHRLQGTLEYVFSRPQLLEEALTHRSYAHEHQVEHNERLEFLGDSVLNAATTILLFKAFPKATEGEMSRLRSRLVNTDTLAQLAVELDLGPLLRLGVGEDQSGGRHRASVLADACEAVLGAIFLDASFSRVVTMVERLLGTRIAALQAGGTRARVWKDPRSALQELTQARFSQDPRYVITERSGPDHNPTFTASVQIEERVLGAASGPSKRVAYQRAALAALEELG